jgi:hypothetical protein
MEAKIGSSTWPVYSGDGVPDAALFVDATKAVARSNALMIAREKGTGVFLQKNKSPEAKASLAVAAKASANSAPRHGKYGLTPAGHAFDEARKHDVTKWWTWSFRNDTPPDDCDDDEYYSADAVQGVFDAYEAEMAIMRGDFASEAE